jgi:predicted Zn-dependent peptidase
MLNFSLTTLPSGLPVIRIPMPAVESVTVLVLCNTGSRYEKPEQYGIAHFFEHMVFKGTKKYPTAQALAGTVDGIGADFNAFTGKEYTGYYVKSAAQHLGLALDVVSDMLLAPALRQEDIDREKGVIVEELNLYVDTPHRHIADLFDNMIFKGNGLEHDIVGNKSTIKSLKTEDFQTFLQSWYGPGNMLLILAGDGQVVESEATMDQIRVAFSKEAGERVKNKIGLEQHLEKDPISRLKLHVEHKKTEQAHFILGWPGINRHDPDRYALSLLSTILGGNMSSRLFTEVREKRGLCYYVHSDVDQAHDGGVFGASAGVDPNRIEEALEVTINEFTSLVDGKKPVTEEDLKKAKDYVAGKMTLGLEDSESVAQFFGMKQLLHNKIETPEEVMEKLQAVNLEEVTAVAKRLIKPGQMRLAVIGPFTEKAKFEKVL